MKYLTVVLALLTLSLAVPTKSYAESDAACAIWLCLPTGFGQGCGDAKSEFKKRIKKGRSPLPDLGSCIVKSVLGNSNQSGAKASVMSSKDGIGALISSHTTCDKWARKRSGGETESYCAKTKIVPAYVQHNVYCQRRTRDNDESPKHCTRTVRYVQTFMDGKQFGSTYYFDGSGNKINVN